MEAPLLIKKGTRRPDFKHKSVKRVKHQLRKHATHTRTTRSGVVWNYSRSHLCCHTKARKWLIAMLMSGKVRMHACIHPKIKSCSINTNVCTFKPEQASYNSRLSFKG